MVQRPGLTDARAARAAGEAVMDETTSFPRPGAIYDPTAEERGLFASLYTLPPIHDAGVNVTISLVLFRALAADRELLHNAQSEITLLKDRIEGLLGAIIKLGGWVDGNAPVRLASNDELRRVR